MIHKISTSVEHPILIVGYTDSKDCMALDIVGCDHIEDLENILDNISVAIDGALTVLEGLTIKNNPETTKKELDFIRASKIEYIIRRLRPCAKGKVVNIKNTHLLEDANVL